MKVSVSDVNPTQKRITVELPAEEVQPELDAQYRLYAGKVRIRGFRPGRVPRNVLKAFYGKFIEEEVAKKFIDRTFPDALKQEDIKPLAEADLEDFAFLEDGGFRYAAIVEVAPVFEASGYRGMELKKPAYGPVTDDDVEKAIAELQEQKISLEPVEQDVVEKGLVVTCDVTPYVDGNVQSQWVGEDLLIDTEEDPGLYHPDFAKNLLGSRVGETVEFELEYAHSDQAPTESWVGKKVKFYVDIKRVSRKIVPEVNDDFAKEFGCENLEELRTKVKERLEQSQREEMTRLIREQIDKKLLEMHDIPVPEKVVQNQTESKIRDLEVQYLRQGIQLDEDAFRTPEIRRMLQPSAETSVKLGIILDRIAEQEGIELSPEEEEEIYNGIAQVLKKDVNEVREQMAGTSLVERMKTNKIREKVYRFIEENAVINEVDPEEFFGQDEEDKGNQEEGESEGKE
ncbi:trigger factor [Thermodesulforhabdus norvegica]|uniref:Trigger factor n=1 Tax=Thermodesulforhabdus norvegica TaxID=39841 RepID=A0A1I4W1V5_9BACT|nr:trigger factor [Thermodesulforhabdus norvegica]SFN07337.1 trigger factor [Thermodesulforhabdus norvegica]